MILKKKIIQKILAIVLALELVISPVSVRLAFAEEVVSSGETTSQETTTAETTSGVTPTPPPESTITTGDASATSEVETTANTNQDTVPGEITTPPGDCTPPEGETTCPTDVTISNDNSADVSDSAGSEATTGDNQITGSSGDATIITGDATASGTIENEINSNTVILEPSPTPSVEPEALTGLHPVRGQEEQQTLTVENNNEGTVTNDANISASTGENLASENLGDAQIQTGDALALANLLNLLNTNIVGSNFEVLILDLFSSGNGDIDLNELWKLILEANGGESLVLVDGSSLSNLQILVQNLNQASLENNVNVSAGTGENQANENNNASIQTGDATALANVTNIVNTNILGSQFFFGVINVFGFFEGNLILPRPEMFSSNGISQGNGSTVIFENQNQAEIQDQVLASAQTGENQETNNQGDNIILTGNAQAGANSFSLVNLNIFRNNWFFLIINNLGNWTGRIFGWSSPSAQEEPNEESQIFQLGLDEQTQSEQDIGEEGILPPLTFQNQNQATVKNNIQTQALTGGNQTNENRGNTSIRTGNAFALANLFNFVNLNILGGRWFIGLVNVLGNWTGDTIFAYPDVGVSLSNGSGQVMVGQRTEYTLIYKNQGYDEASGVSLKLELPEGVNYLGDTSGVSPSIDGRILIWNIGGLKVGEEGSFQIEVEIDSQFSFEEVLSFWSKIIPQARAAENEKEKQITVTALIGTSDPESNLANNTSSTTTLVYLPTSEPVQESQGSVDQRQPVLEISAWNNVGEFVYPGDTVTFEITVKNTGVVPSYETRLVQTLYNGVPEDFGVAEFDLGTIEPGKGGKLSFGLKLADDGLLPAGPYYTIAKAYGKSPNGNEVSSNEARTDFEIRLREISSLFEAEAIGKEEEILGSATNASCPKTEDILPYVLLLLLSSAYIINWAKPKLGKEGE